MAWEITGHNFIMSKTKYANISTPFSVYTAIVGYTVGIQQTYMQNANAKIHKNYIEDRGVGVFTVSSESLYKYSVNYYDARTGNHLGVINFNKMRNRWKIGL